MLQLYAMESRIYPLKKINSEPTAHSIASVITFRRGGPTFGLPAATTFDTIRQSWDRFGHDHRGIALFEAMATAFSGAARQLGDERQVLLEDRPELEYAANHYPVTSTNVLRWCTKAINFLAATNFVRDPAVRPLL